MLNRLNPLVTAIAALLALCTTCVPASPAAVCQPDFAFVQVSDLHFPHPFSEKTLAELRNLGQVYLAPYKTTATAPSFIIATGDLTEFGPANGAWDSYKNAVGTIGLPVYSVLGNHDTTWRSLSYELTQEQGSTFYSWNAFGCHFVVLRSAGIQDPRPLTEPQQIEWLKRDLESIAPETPVFVALHHPLDTKEYSSPYETDRLVEILRRHNVAAILVGHSHSIVHTIFEGMDMIRGGSTWGPCAPGCVIYSVAGGRLRAAYKMRGNTAATIPLLDKALRRENIGTPVIEIVSPGEFEECANELIVRAHIVANGVTVQSVRASVDNSQPIDLSNPSGSAYEGQIPVADLDAGVHYVRVTASFSGVGAISKSRIFRIKRAVPRVHWRADLGAASKSTPAVSDRVVYVGANDGWMRAYDRSSGELLWRYATGGPITGEPLLMGDRLYFGSEDTYFYCVTADRGYLVWRFKVGSPVYSSAVGDGKLVYFGSSSGAFYALDADSGQLIWVNNDATYTIESKPFITGGRIYYGAWDCYVYCVDATTGKLIWKCMGQGSAEGKAPAYYSPADCGPVVCGGKVFVADRKYRLSVIDAETGTLEGFLDGVSAVALSLNGDSLYIRRLDGRLEKLDCERNNIWSTHCQTDDVPAAPREADGMVYVSSKRGLVSAVAAKDGKIHWQYQATPLSYVFSTVAASSGIAYVSGTDGSLTAVGE